MPSVTIYSSASDGYISKSNISYFTARIYTTGFVSNTDSLLGIGQKHSTYYYIYRAFLFFDTSSIPANATITSAKIGLYKYNDYSYTNFDIVVQNGQPTYPHDPLESGDYYYNNYSGNGGSLDTANLVNGYNEIVLNSDGISWINKGGQTKFCLRSNRDINGYQPSGNEYVEFYSNEGGSGYQPYLYIEYTIPEKDVTADIYIIPRADIESNIHISGTETKSVSSDLKVVDRLTKPTTSDIHIKGTETKHLTTDVNILEPIYVSMFFNKVSLYKAISTIADLSLANFYVDENNDFWFYPRSVSPDTGVVIDESNYISAKNLTDQDYSQFYNAVQIIGGKILAYREDIFTGDGSTKTYKLSRKPAKDLLVTIDTIPQIGGMAGEDTCTNVDYLYDKDTNEITFCTAPADGSDINISYFHIVQLRYYAIDPESVAKYGLREHEPIINEQFAKYEMLIYYGEWFLAKYSLPKLQGSITVDMDLVGTVLHAGDTVTLNLPRYRINNEKVRIEKITYNITPTRTTATLIFVRRKDLAEFLGRVYEKLEQLRQAMQYPTDGTFESDMNLSDSVTTPTDGNVIEDNSPPYYWGTAFIDRNIVEDDNVYG